MSILLTVIGLFLQLGFSHSIELEGWKTIEIPCTCSNCKDILSNLTHKTELVFADCGNGTFYLAEQELKISHVNTIRITGKKASVIEDKHSINTGISFKNVSDLHLEDLKIRHCRRIKIETSTNIEIINITIENSRGTGMVLKNNEGVHIMNSTFQNNNHNNLNKKESSHPGSDGLKSMFTGGGGLRILIEGVMTSSVTIEDCLFLNNIALNGGGMFVTIYGKAKNNTVIIRNNKFTGNKCQKGGGGLRIGYIHKPQKNMKENRISIEYCIFSNNEALYGGGTAVFSSLGPPAFSNNKIKLEHCLWINNTARLGMAVDISIAPLETFTRTGLFPSPEFVNCVFSKHNYTQSPRGVLSVVGFLLRFEGEIIFQNNNATAIEATSAVLDFNPYSSVKFINNQGVNGGALKLRGLTLIFVRANSIFLFDRNKARVRGGAIYVESYDEHSIFSSKSCFIQYRKKQKQSLKPQNVSFILANNSAGITNNEDMHRGDSVYATTLTPCLEKCTKTLTNVSIPLDEIMKCIGNFTFDKIGISTAADHFSELTSTKEEDSMCSLIVSNDQIRRNLKYNHLQKDSIKSVLHFIPGKMKEVPLKLVDEFCNKVLFKVSVTVIESKQKTIFVDSAHSIVTDNRIALFGSPQ